MDGHSSRRRIAAGAHQQPTRKSPLNASLDTRRTLVGAPGRHAPPGNWVSPEVPSLFGLAPCGVYPASTLYSASGALLPHLFTLTPSALRPSWRYLLCGTSRLRAFTPESRTLSGTLPCGVRTFLPRATCFRTRAAAVAQPTCKPYRNLFLPMIRLERHRLLPARPITISRWLLPLLQPR